MKTREPVGAIIACVHNDRYLGLNGQLMAHVPGDLAHFKKLTAGHCVVMGWNTAKSLPRHKALPNRVNIIIVNTLRVLEAGAEDRDIFNSLAENQDVIFASSMADADALARAYSTVYREGYDKYFIIGGGKVYTDALAGGFVKEAIITHASVITDPEVKGDVEFPIELLEEKLVCIDVCKHIPSMPGSTLVTWGMPK